MLSQTVWMLTCVLLVLTLCPDVLSRRGGFGGGRWGGVGRAGVGGGWGAHRGAGVGGGHQYKTHSSGSSSSGSNAGKMAGAAAAGALGGMVIGHGLGSMSRPGYGYGNSWHGGYGYGPGYGGGYSRYGEGHGNGRIHQKDGGSTNETDMEYYAGAASRGSTYSYVLLLGVFVSFLIACWIF